MRRELNHWLALLSFSLFVVVMMGILIYPNHFAHPIHNSRIQSILIQQIFQGSDEIDSSSITYNNPSPRPLKDALWADRKGVHPFTQVDDLNLRGMVYVPSGSSWGQVYLPIYEGVSDHVLYYGAGTAQPDQVMGENQFITTAYNNADNSWLTHHPSFYSGLANVTEEVLGTVFWTTDGESIFEWEVDELNQVGDVEEWNQELTEEGGRMTLVTEVDEGEYVVLSGPLQSQQAIEADYQTTLELFRELSVLQIKRPKGVGHVMTNSRSLTAYKEDVHHSLRKNQRVLTLFNYLDHLLLIWHCLNLIWGTVILYPAFRSGKINI